MVDLIPWQTDNAEQSASLTSIRSAKISDGINTMQVDGSPIVFDTWQGARDGVGRPHGPGVVIADNYEGVLCSLDHEVIAGSSLWRRESGGRRH